MCVFLCGVVVTYVGRKMDAMKVFQYHGRIYRCMQYRIRRSNAFTLCWIRALVIRRVEAMVMVMHTKIETVTMTTTMKEHAKVQFEFNENRSLIIFHWVCNISIISCLIQTMSQKWQKYGSHQTMKRPLKTYSSRWSTAKVCIQMQMVNSTANQNPFVVEN